MSNIAPEPAREVERLLTLLQRQLKVVERHRRIEAWDKAFVRNAADPALLARCVVSLCCMQREFEFASLRLAGSGRLPVAELSPDLHAFYECDYPRMIERVEDGILRVDYAAVEALSALFELERAKLALELVRNLGETSSSVGFRSEPGQLSNLIVGAVASSIELLELSEELEPDHPARMANMIVHEAFFRPDEWWSNWNSLGPVLVVRQSAPVPSHLREGLREAHHSYIFGNVRAVVALCRSILEVALVEQGPPIGIKTMTPDGARSRPLQKLVNEFSTQLPNLASQLKLLVESGNKVMHPASSPDVLPPSARLVAKECLVALRFVLEAIYSNGSASAAS